MILKKFNGGGTNVGRAKNKGIKTISEEGKKEVLRYAEFIKEKESGNAR